MLRVPSIYMSPRLSDINGLFLFFPSLTCLNGWQAKLRPIWRMRKGTWEGSISEVKELEVHMPFPQYLDPGLMNHTASYSGISSNDEF